jgi:hypothetical protein
LTVPEDVADVSVVAAVDGSVWSKQIITLFLVFCRLTFNRNKCWIFIGFPELCWRGITVSYPVHPSFKWTQVAVSWQRLLTKVKGKFKTLTFPWLCSTDLDLDLDPDLDRASFLFLSSPFVDLDPDLDLDFWFGCIIMTQVCRSRSILQRKMQKM